MGYYIASPSLRDGENILDTIQNIAKTAEGYIQQGQGAVQAGTDAYNSARDAYNTATGGGSSVPVKNPEQYAGTHPPQYGASPYYGANTGEGAATEEGPEGEAYGPPLPPGYVDPTTTGGRGNGKTFVVVGLLVATVGYIAKTWGK